MSRGSSGIGLARVTQAGRQSAMRTGGNSPDGLPNLTGAALSPILHGAEDGSLAERVGFEPTESCNSALFKSAAFDRSATSPRERIAAARTARSVARISSRVGVSAAAVSGSMFLETRNVSSPVVTMPVVLGGEARSALADQPMRELQPDAVAERRVDVRLRDIGLQLERALEGVHREVGPDAQQHGWQRGLDRHRGHDPGTGRAALPRVDGEEHEWGAIALGVELREERLGAGEVRLELPAHVRVGQVILVEREPAFGNASWTGESPIGCSCQPAGAAGRTAPHSAIPPGPARIRQGNRPGEQRQGGCGARDDRWSDLDHDRARDEVEPATAPLVDEDPDVANVEHETGDPVADEAQDGLPVEIGPPSTSRTTLTPICFMPGVCPSLDQKYGK